MRGMINVESPNKLEATLRVTLPIYKWKEVREDLGKTSFNSGDRYLSDLIDELVGQADKVLTTFEAEVNENAEK